MTSILKGMQETVIKYAEVLSKVLRVDVEIVDKHLLRIAGTGMFADNINEYISEEGYVYNQVMKTGKYQMIMDPGKHSICKYCHKQGKCEETFEVSMPIKIDEKVIGVIGLVCFSKEQRDHIIDNLSIFTAFLEQISDLMSSKAREELEKHQMLNLIELLKNVIDKVEQGVLIVDQNINIVRTNNTAVKMLELESLNSKIKIRKTENQILNLNEYEIVINNKLYTIIGEDYKIVKNENDYDQIFIFTDLDSLSNLGASINITKENLGLDNIIGDSSEIKFLKSKVKKVATSNSTVLITGESGTGKELFARAIHMESERCENAFVAINCAAIPDALLESELFGYVKGAFTGADPKGKIGKIEFANNGTLFLDEIGDMPLYLQSKLLRVLEQREIVRLGSNSPMAVDVRIIAATNKNLEKLIEDGMFREDLFYRLNVIPFTIPPLRHRKEDIRIMTDYFTIKYSKLFKKGKVEFTNGVFDIFYKYKWPGNVRELENVVEYIMNMVEKNGIVNAELLPKKLLLEEELDTASLSLEAMEKEYIKKALKLYGNTPDGKQEAASQLGIGIATLYRKIKKYNL
ncbi:sigma 54-interacting transcriptional regulator [Tissierella praeacuta]|uniref:sigma-54-dependent Fis family transcriptional regulator n=1 Tax=Tissierella praeacuta TaxID=43131 RepID=UPI0033404027